MRNPIRTSTALFVLSGLLASAAPAPAQSPPEQAGSRSQLSKNAGPVVSIDFPGGTINDFIKAVQKAAAPAAVNVIRPAEAASVQAPPISLRNVTVKTALESLRFAFQDSGEHRFQVEDFGGDAGSEPVYAVRYGRMSSRAAAPPPADDRTIEVFSIRDLIEPTNPGADPSGTISRDHILSAVDTALRLDDRQNETPPEIKYHQDTGLLIVRGTGEQVNLIRALLLRVRDDAKSRRSDAEVFGSQLRGLEGELRRMMTELDVKKKEADMLKARLDRSRKLRDAGTASEDELAAIELQYTRGMGEVQMVSARIEQLEQEIKARREARPATAEPTTAVYDLADLAAAGAELEALAQTLTGGNVQQGPDKGKGFSLVVTAPEAGQELFKQALAAVRKAVGTAAKKTGAR